MLQTEHKNLRLGGVWPGYLGILVLGLVMLPPFLSCVLAKDQAKNLANDTDAQLHVIEQDRLRTAARSTQLQKENEAIAKEKAELQERLVAAGRGALSQEAALMLLEGEIVKTESERLRRRDLWHKNQAYMGAMLGALERLALRPPPALLLSSLMAPPHQAKQPSDARRQVARVGIVLTSLVPLMNARAQRLQVDMLDLQALEHRLQQQKLALNQTKQSLALRRAVIVQLLNRRQVLEAANRAETQRLAARMASLAQSSRSLRELAAKIETAPPPIGRMDSNIATPPNASKFGDDVANKSPHLTPVAGSVVMQWGQIDSYGQAARGLTLQTRPGATVIAPAHGRVLFAGPFHNYAGVLIIGTSSEYVCVITGLGQISVQIGDNVKAGEAVGVVDTQKDSLYFEVRHQGKPINPMPWLKES